MAKDLVRTRHQIEKFYKLKSQLQGVSLRIQVFYGDYYYLAYMVNIIGFIMSQDS
jgi:charged multivesicular body protein 2A